jgi:hypothetical protein
MSRKAVPRDAFVATNCCGRWMLPMLAAIAIAMLTLPQTAAAGSEACRPRSEIIAYLARVYGELPRATGLTDAGNLIEVLSTSDGATWSIIVTAPNGMSCAVATGENWRALREGTAEDIFHHAPDAFAPGPREIGTAGQRPSSNIWK